MKEPLDDFSLVAGGPLYRFWRRARLLKPPLDLLIFRIVVTTLLAWLPLIALAFVSGNALKGVPVPFLFDLDAHVRFLIALPLLIAAELFVHRRLRAIVRQFADRGIVAPEEREKFQNIVDSTLRLRDSVIAELLMIVLIWTLGHSIWERRTSLGVATWYASREGDNIHYTLAGYWYAFGSIPIFQFLLLRWYYRLAIWWRFLWKASHLDLKLIPTHPDKAGGLGFLGDSAYAFAPVLAAHTVLFAGIIANRVWHEAASLPEFKLEIAGILACLLSLAFAPLTAFASTLLKTKRIGLEEFGKFSQLYVQGFDAKWFRGDAPETERLLGSSDIQSLADLANGYEVVQRMRAVPFGKETVFRLAVLLILPFLPLIPTILPVEKIFAAMAHLLL